MRQISSNYHPGCTLFGIFLGVTIILFVTFTLGTINCGYHRIIPWSPQVVTNLSEAPGSGSIVDLKTRPHVGERHPTFVQWIKKKRHCKNIQTYHQKTSSNDQPIETWNLQKHEFSQWFSSSSPLFPQVFTMFFSAPPLRWGVGTLKISAAARVTWTMVRTGRGWMEVV